MTNAAVERLRDLSQPADGMDRLMAADEIERLRAKQDTNRAEAWSEAADMAANNWNLQPRNEAWCAMTPCFQEIWRGMKATSKEYHEAAEEGGENDIH